MEKKRETKREIIISVGLAVLFAFFLTAGWQMENEKENLFHHWETYLSFSFFFLLFSVGILLGFRRLQKKERTQQETVPKEPGSKMKKSSFFLLQAGMILCWIPVLLSAYPGFFCYDATYQFKEVAEGIYNMHHPLLHTFMLGKTLTLSKAYLGSYEAGVLIFCILQMILITGCFCMVIRFMERHGVGKGLLIASYCYYSLYPTCVMFGLCTTKDSIFTALVTVHLLFLFELLTDKEEFFHRPVSVAFFALTAVGAMLFRNNGVYSYLLFLPFFVVLARGIRRKSLVLAGGCVIVAVLFTKGLALWFGAENNDGLREMLSVPAQQLARTYDREGSSFFEEEEKQKLYSFISEGDLERYNGKLADPVKANLHVGLNSTLPEFVGLWLRTGIRAPEIYMDALLMQTYQAWYPFTIPDGYCGGNAKERYRGSESCYFALETEEPAKADSKLPGLLKGYEFIARHMTFDSLPVIPVIFSIGTMFWILLYMLAYAVCCKKGGAAGMLLLILCLCMTCLLGPIMLVRYYLILFFALPLVAGSYKLI